MATSVSGQFVKDAIDMRPWTGPVIDLGAGGYSNYYKPHFKGSKYDELDIAPQPKGTANIIADILNMPKVLSDSYGVVLLCETLEHLSDPFAAFKESARILRPGGLFICTTVACWCEHQHPKDFWRFLPDGLAHLCSVAGLKMYLERLEPRSTTSNSHCMVAATK